MYHSNRLQPKKPTTPAHSAPVVPTHPNERHLSSAELASRWGLAIKTVDRWRTEGLGPVFVRLPGRVVYRMVDIEAFEQRLSRISTSQPLVAAPLVGLLPNGARVTGGAA